MEVGMMVASDVPTASFIATSLFDVQQIEQVVEHRHDHDATADAEEPCQHAAEKSHTQQYGRHDGELSHCRGQLNTIRIVAFFRCSSSP
jgi:hypothetical protein